MGRTTPTATDLLRREVEECKPFKNSLPKKDMKEFELMLKGAHIYNYAMMMALPEHPVPVQPIMMSVIFQHYTQLQKVMQEFDVNE